MQVWSFFGERQHRALTPNEMGALLPPEFAPWVRYKKITLSDDDEQDRAAIEAIRDVGYHLYRSG